MINRINSYNNVTNVRFGAYKPTLIKRINVSNLRDSQQKINSIKKVCEEIFSAIKVDKSIIEKVNSSLKSIKLADNSILFLDGLENSIKYSKAKTNDKELFIMEILNKNLSKFSIALDSFGSLVKDYNEQSFNYFDSEEINKELLEDSFDKFYNTTDEPLFKLRMFIRKNALSQETSEDKIDIEVPKVESYVAKKKPSEKETYLEQKADLIKKLPRTGISHNYSYREVIHQNNQQEKELIKKDLLASKQYQEEVLGTSIFSRIDKNVQKAKKEKEREVKRQKFAYKMTTSKNELSEKRAEKSEVSTIKIKEVKLKEKKVKVKNEILPKIKEKKVTLPKEPSVKRKVGRPRKEAVVVNEQIITEKKRRGRPKKTEITPLEIKVKKIKNKGNLELAGYLDIETRDKVNKISNLYDEIRGMLSKLSCFTVAFANSTFQRVKLGKRNISIDNIGLRFFKRKTWGDSEAITITDTKTNNKLNILDSSKIISSKFDLDKLISLDKAIYLTQNEIKSESQKNISSEILTQAISKIEEYKSFLERKGWRSVERRLAGVDEGMLQTPQLELLKTVEEKYNKVRTKLQRMNSGKSCCIKRDYGIVPIKSARLEFIDAFKDGYNLIFSKAKTKYGELYLVVKHSGKDVLEEVFAISQDGKLVKNINKNFGLNKIINHKEKNVKYINNEQIEKENILARLEEILSSLDKKMDDCMEYIENYKYIKK